MQAAPPLPLPLREDLKLYPTAPERDGAPAWVIQDPVSNRFYRIGWFEYECLLRWPGDPVRIATDISARTALQADASLVQEFAAFLERNHLVRPSAQGLERLKQQANAPGWRHWKWWLHHYLFIRVPLVRPERWLSALLPWVAPLFTRTALLLLIAASLLGLVLVMRQWDSFTHGVLDLISPSGIAGFVLALIVSKTLHELGHALVATRQGLRVAHMGVAFLVMWPMLYTDTGESWRLRSHRQRLAISIAGIGVELAIAGLATLAWALLDDGAARQAMLYLATTAWVLSLALNLSPFMRFDGYFILSDLLDFPNLHERAGAMAKACLRRNVLGLPDPWPEPMSARTRSVLMAFALATWLYRLVVFLGIAWAVYAFFFKVLGIFLLVVELAWFIAMPIWKELKVWHERWPEVGKRRRGLLLVLAAALLAWLAIPWYFDVTAPALAHPARQQAVHAPLPAQVLALQPAGVVKAGQDLARFAVPELEDRQRRVEATIQALEQRLSGLMADTAGMARRQAFIRQLREQQAELTALAEERARLRVAAEFDGQWLDVAPDLGPGSWIDPRSPLGVLVDPGAWVIDAYVGQRDVGRLAVGTAARFHPHGEIAAVEARVVFIDSARSQRLAHPMLDGRHGGPVSTQTAIQQEGVPVDALYRVRLALAEPLPGLRETRGTVSMEGERRSLLWHGLQQLTAVLVRESGF
ncbi:site-2 protease family protein [Thauera sp. Sel9]|uniref:site-2 protease family protein n=1 Tax=Thauera sp. Sel9 TaxID=2974299 RepID=UPI0021E12340|nr:site-2 protease family protein [Thauera sp. Sel9]MCV2216907.1 secretion protein HylD [Thauera sp. Sel9]